MQRKWFANSLIHIYIQTICSKVSSEDTWREA